MHEQRVAQQAQSYLFAVEELPRSAGLGLVVETKDHPVLAAAVHPSFRVVLFAESEGVDSQGHLLSFYA